jgi:hypothetical protein
MAESVAVYHAEYSSFMTVERIAVCPGDYRVEDMIVALALDLKWEGEATAEVR